MTVQRAIDCLEDIEIHVSPSSEVIREVESAVQARANRIRRNGKVSQAELSELATRSRFVKEAVFKLEYELRAFVGATKRHGKDRVLYE